MTEIKTKAHLRSLNLNRTWEINSISWTQQKKFHTLFDGRRKVIFLNQKEPSKTSSMCVNYTLLFLVMDIEQNYFLFKLILGYKIPTYTEMRQTYQNEV
jgi:hypothetical protein